MPALRSELRKARDPVWNHVVCVCTSFGGIACNAATTLFVRFTMRHRLISACLRAYGDSSGLRLASMSR